MRFVTSVSTREYDAFGPWVDDVPNAEELPRLYADAGIDFATAVRVLKVPREIVRREATPDMHLYDYLLVLEPNQLTILRRTDDSYDRTAIRYEHIVAMVQSADLLDGRLTLRAASGESFTVGYNGAAGTTIRALVDQLGALSLAAASPLDLSGVPVRAPLDNDELGKRDVGIVNDYRRESGLSLFAAHGSATAKPKNPSLRSLLRPVRLAGAIVSGNPYQLVVLSRREALRGTNRPDISSARTVIALGQVTGAASHAHPDYDGITVVAFELGKGVVEFVVPSGSESERALLAVGKIAAS
jgi:hypothetical protein